MKVAFVFAVLLVLSLPVLADEPPVPSALLRFFFCERVPLIRLCLVVAECGDAGGKKLAVRSLLFHGIDNAWDQLFIFFLRVLLV